jgi:hypothetical protein
MTTSHTMWLTKPEGDEKVSLGTFGYINARIRQRAYDVIIREFKRSGLTQEKLCCRWGKTPDYVSKILARPSNLELNTFSEALFAISGAIPMFNLAYPLEQKIAVVQLPSSVPPKAQAAQKPISIVPRPPEARAA